MKKSLFLMLFLSYHFLWAIPCSGVFSTTLDGDGALLVSGNGLTYLRLCYLNAPPDAMSSSNKISIETCKILYSKLLALELANRPCTIMFHHGNAKFCKDIALPWQYPTEGNSFLYLQ